MERNLDEKKKYLKDHEDHFSDLGFSTRAIHSGQAPDKFYGSVNFPVHFTSTYAQVDINKPYYDYDYSRGGNPTRTALETCVASLEQAKHCLSFSSGCSATLIITHLLK